jgi:hypothetical protein
LELSEVLKAKSILKKGGWVENEAGGYVGVVCYQIYHQVDLLMDGKLTAPTLIKNEIEQPDKPSMEFVGDGFVMAFPCRYCEWGIKSENIGRHEKEEHPEEYKPRMSGRTGKKRERVSMPIAKVISKTNSYLGIRKQRKKQTKKRGKYKPKVKVEASTVALASEDKKIEKLNERYDARESKQLVS